MSKRWMESSLPSSQCDDRDFWSKAFAGAGPLHRVEGPRESSDTPVGFGVPSRGSSAEAQWQENRAFVN